MTDIAIFQKIYEFVMENKALSYWIIFLSTLLETTVFIGLFIPAIILIIVSGFIAYNGYLDGSLIIFIAILGAIIGDTLNYFLGKYYKNKNRSGQTTLIEKIFKQKKYLNYSKEFFQKHGGKSILLGRFIGIIRPFISFIAGSSEMPLGKFMYFNIIGAIICILIYFEIGYLFGSSIEILINSLERIEYFLLIALLILLSFLYLRSIFKRKIKSEILKKSNELLKKIEE
ncbi:MAG: DedA family protein [Patescibacteria group bacterium]